MQRLKYNSGGICFVISPPVGSYRGFLNGGEPILTLLSPPTRPILMRPFSSAIFQGGGPCRFKSDFMSIFPNKRRLFFAWALIMSASRMPAQNDNRSYRPQNNTDAENAPDIILTIIAHVPEGSGSVYITGNRPEFGFWNAGFCAMEGDGEMPRSTRLKASGASNSRPCVKKSTPFSMIARYCLTTSLGWAWGFLFF